MREDCIKAVTRAAAGMGRTLKPGDFDKIEQRIAQARKDIAAQEGDAFANRTPKEQITLAAQRVAKDIQDATRKKAQNIAAAVRAKEATTAFIKGQQAKGEHGLDAINRINVTDQDLGSNVASVEQTRRGVYADAMRHIQAMYAATKEWGGFWTNKESVRDFVREVNGEDTGNKAAKRAAEKWLGATESLRTQYNELGGNIRKLAYGYLPHKWDVYKLKDIKPEAFAKEIVDRLDGSKYRDETGRRISRDSLIDMLKDIHGNIVTGGAFGKQFEKAMANRHQDRRVLHFKTADDWLDVNTKFGQGSVMEAMMSHANSMSKEIAAMKVWGPNPDNTFRQVLEETHKGELERNPGARDKTDAKVSVAESMYHAAIGRMSPIANMKVFRAFQVIRSLNLLKLTGSALSAISDGSNVTAVAHAWSIPYVRRYLYGLKAWNPFGDFRQRMISQGIGIESLAHGIARWGEENMSQGATGRFAQMMLKLFGINHIDTVRRTATGAMLMNDIERMAAKHETLDTLDPHDHAVVLHRGVTPEDWAVWRAAGKDLSPDAIAQVKDADIAHLGNPDRLRRDAAQKLLGVALSDIDTVVPLMTAKTQGKVEASGWTGKRGTIGGELIRSFLTFKSFPLANFQNHLDRMASQEGLGKAVYAAQVIATSTIMGAITVQLKAMANGENPQDMTNPKFLARALVQGGALGLYFDILAGTVVNLHGDKPKDAASVLADQMGPTAGSIKDILSMLQLPAQGQTAADFGAKEGEKAARLVRGYSPAPFYAKAAFDRLIYQRILDMFSPGNAERMKDRVHSQYNSSYFWNPSTAQRVEPPQAPNLNTAVGRQ